MNNKITLDSTDTSKLISILKKKFINLYRILYEVDPREADKFQSLNHYYFDQSHCKTGKCTETHDDHHSHQHSHHEKHHSEHKHDHNHDEVMTQFFIPEKELTFTQKLLYDMHKDYKLQQILPDILDDFAKKFENIKQGGIKDNLAWDDQAEEFVLTKVLAEGLTKALASCLRKEIQRDQHVESKQPLLLATPQSWYEKFPKIKLDFLTPDLIKSLFDKGFAICPNFVPEIGFPRVLDHEVKYFYHEGRFEEPTLSEAKTRNDKILSFSLTHIDPNTSKNLYHICRILTSLPFELNLKASIYAQVSEGFQLSYFNEENGFQGVHYDSSFKQKYDNGKKLSALYLFSEKSDYQAKPKLILHKPESTDVLEEIPLNIGSLYLLKSRVIPYSLKDIPNGMFILRYWVNGPVDQTNFNM